MPQSARWFISRCFERHRNIEWTVFLCYDTDDYKNDISKFYEGDWGVLRNSLQKKAHSVVDIAAAADIEDVLLQDISGISTYLGSEVVLPIPAGRKGKVKMKNLYRKMGKTYHEGRRSRAMIDALDMQLIIDSNIVSLCEIETLLFK